MSTAPTSFCAICQSPIQPGELATACPACQSPYHDDCWRENGGCGVYGCPQVPPTEKLGELEIPASYWGKENKPCPSCGREILAAALRCRHCGVVFESAAPESTGRFQNRQDLLTRLPGVRTGVVWLFVCCLLPCTAPLATLFGLFWRHARREELRALPSLYAALSKIAVIIGALQTVLIVAMIYMYTVLRRH